MTICACPLCGQKAEWKDASAEVAHICCDGSCGTFKIVIAEREFFATLSTDQLTKLSVFNNRITANNGISTFDYDFVDRILQGYCFAEEAASRFGLHQIRIEHSGGFDATNPNFFVYADEGRFTLRVFPPSMTKDELSSLLLWMKILRDKADVIVPEPMPAPDGTLFLQMKIAQASKARFCALFHWIEGERMEFMPTEKRTSTTLGNYGATVARIHQHATDFSIPPWFAVPRHDIEAFRRRLNTPESKGNSSASEQEIACKHKIDLSVLKLMEKLGESRDVFGITHGDISTWNTLVCGEELAIIDFMTVGWDYYLFDLFRTLENGLEPTEQEDFVRGYERVRSIPEHFAEYSAIIRAAK